MASGIPFEQSDKQRLDVLAGVRGNDQDRAVRVKELSRLAGQVATINDIASAPVSFDQVTGTVSQNQLSSTAVYSLLTAAGLAPVEIVTTLPTTGNFEGRTVYLTTDKKLYRWNGTHWTAAVQTVDLVGQIVADQVANGAITTAKFATGIAAVEIVAILPSTGNFQGRTVYLTTDNKLYRHTGSPTGSTGFTAAIPAVDVTGQLTDAQIAAIAAAKVTGQITATQITDGSISTPKLQAGAVTTAALAAGAVTAGNIAAGAVTAGKIAAGAITANEIAADTITAGQIAAGAVSTSELAAGAVNADKIAASAVTADKIAAFAIIADKIATDAVTADKIQANAITAGKIAANAVTTGIIAAGAVTADRIAANAITAGKIAASAITTSDLIVDGAVSRRVYAQSSSLASWPGTPGPPVTLTTGLQVIASKTFGANTFADWVGLPGARRNPIIVNIDMEIDIGASAGAGWLGLQWQFEFNITEWVGWFSRDFKIPLDAGPGAFQYSKSFIIESGAWSSVQAARIRMLKAATSTVIKADGSFMMTQISV